MEPVALVVRALFDLGRDLSQRWRRVRVRTHVAVFEGSTEPCLMINVANVGQRPITVTHVWLAVTPEVHVVNPMRPLPKPLQPDEPWETWIPLSVLASQLTGLSYEEVLRSARVRLSTARTLRARPNRDVPAFGAVPGAES